MHAEDRMTAKKKKKKAKKAVARERLPTITDLMDMHERSKNYYLDRIGTLRAEFAAMKKKMDGRMLQLELNQQARDKEVARLHELATAGSAWVGRADEWAKHFCTAVAASFRAGAAHMERAGDGQPGASQEELREEQVEGAANMIRSGLKLLDDEGDE